MSAEGMARTYIYTKLRVCLENDFKIELPNTLSNETELYSFIDFTADLVIKNTTDIGGK